MDEFVKELAQLPQDIKEAITKGLQNKIVAQAMMVRDEQPDSYLSYLDSEIESASNAMLEMIKASGQDGAILGNISGIYIWNKERKRVLMELKDEFVKQQPQSLSPKIKKELKDYLPEKLKSNKAVNIFQKAIDGKLIECTAEHLIWKDTKQLLAYFAEKMSNKFGLTNKVDKDGNITTAWKPFEEIFDEKDIKGAKQNWMRLNTKFEPKGFEKVDSLLI